MRKKTRKPMPAGKGFTRLLFWYISNYFQQFIILICVIGVIITLATTQIKCDKRGIRIEKKDIDIDKIIGNEVKQTRTHRKK